MSDAIPTAGFGIVVLAVSKGFAIHHLVIKTAFLIQDLGGDKGSIYRASTRSFEGISS